MDILFVAMPSSGAENLRQIVSAQKQSYEYTSKPVSAAAEEAKASGLVVDFPDAYTLQLDLDCEDDSYLPRLNLVMTVLEQMAKVSLSVKVTTSRHGGKHARINLPFEVTPLERVAIQACLGSDPLREMLAIKMIREGEETPTVFFELPGWDEQALPEPEAQSLLEAA